MKRHYQKTARNAFFNKFYKRAAYRKDGEISVDCNDPNHTVEIYSNEPFPSSSANGAIASMMGAEEFRAAAISDEDCYIGGSDHSTNNISSCNSTVGFCSSESNNSDDNITEIPSQTVGLSFDQEEDITSGITIKTRLSEWAVKHNISHIAINDLLKILQPSFTDLPLDARTLLRTPRTTILETVEPGSYCHFGFRKCLEKLLTHSHHLLHLNVLEVCINIDGLPLSKSSGSQLYPILCNLFLNKNFVEIIGIYHGNEKPKNANDFLKFFVNEAIEVLNHGISFNNCLYQVKIKAFICDVPAKSYIKYIMGHSGYDSCSKCKIKGVYKEKRVCFPDIENFSLRNDTDFRTKVDENHHTGTSVLELIPGIDMIKDFPLDYMHLVCLGVVKKLIVNLWMGGKVPAKLPFHKISNISKLLSSQALNIPHEFNRKPRSLDEARRWKATEFRLFLFYLGPVILKKNLDTEKYLNFLSLHVSLSYLSSPQWQHKIDYCQSLLKYFVETFIILYGAQNVSHNVHNLLHICDDVRRFGPLDMFSAFPFENHMKNLKKHIRKTDKPLQQIIHRITEEENSTKLSKFPPHISYPKPSNEHTNGPISVDCTYSKQFKKLVFKEFSLGISEPDNCCYLNDDSVAVIKNILVINNEVKLLVQKIMKLEDFYESPCKSSELGIFLASDFGLPELIHSKDISHKCMKLDFEDKYVVLPILHSKSFY